MQFPSSPRSISAPRLLEFARNKAIRRRDNDFETFPRRLSVFQDASPPRNLREKPVTRTMKSTPEYLFPVIREPRGNCQLSIGGSSFRISYSSARRAEKGRNGAEGRRGIEIWLPLRAGCSQSYPQCRFSFAQLSAVAAAQTFAEIAELPTCAQTAANKMGYTNARVSLILPADRNLPRDKPAVLPARSIHGSASPAAARRGHLARWH